MELPREMNQLCRFFLTCFPYITKDSRAYQVSQHLLRMACDGIL